MSNRIKMRSLITLHYVVSVFLFIWCWRFAYDGRYSVSSHPKGDIILFIFYGTTLLLLNRTYDAYDIEYHKILDNIYAQTLSQVITTGMLWIVSLLMYMTWTNPMPLFILCEILLMWNLIWGIITRRINQSFNTPLNTVVVYRNSGDLRRLREFKQFDYKFDIQKQIESSEENLESLDEELEGFEAVALSGISPSLLNDITEYCIERNKIVFLAPQVGDIIIQGSRHVRSFSSPIVSIRRAEPSVEYLLIKRMFDVIVSALAIIVSSPFWLITALAIKLYDNGPILYKQVRLTKDGKTFRILKFRSMKVDAEKDGVARLSSGDNDSRITPVGRVIRKYRLDELPQLINILKGDMSIVGPRPERPEIAEQYEKKLPAFRLRLQVKAGLTGYAQVYGRYNTQPYDKLQMDLMYINKMGIVEDLRLMFATVRILFLPESTEGIAQGATTAMDYENESNRIEINSNTVENLND